jgi:hypothetical protein
MDPIKALLSEFVGRIEITLSCTPGYFEIAFSSPPSDEVLGPVFDLIDSKRFEFTHLLAHTERAKLKELLNLDIVAKNVIPAASAAHALKECWEQMGYQVTVIPQKTSIKSSSTEACWILAEIMAKHDVKGKEIAQDLRVSGETVTAWKRQAPPLHRWGAIARSITKRSRIGRQVIAKDFLE